MVLLWLSQLVLMPFNLALLDSSLADTDQDQRWAPHMGTKAIAIHLQFLQTLLESSFTSNISHVLSLDFWNRSPPFHHRFM